MPKSQEVPKKEFNELTRRIVKISRKWRKLLLLDHWSITVFVANEMATEEGAYHPQDINGYWEVAMSTTSDPYYMTASITVYAPIVRDFDDAQIEESLVHEYMHVYVSSMVKGKHLKEEEAVVTLLARTMLGLQNEGNNKKSRPRRSTPAVKK